MSSSYYISRIFLFYLFLFSCLNIQAQKQGQELADSLILELNTYKSPCQTPCLADSGKVKLLNDLSNALLYINPDTALVLSQNAIQLSEAMKWNFGIGLSYFSTGYVYNRLSDYPLAYKFLSKSLKIIDAQLLSNTNMINLLRLKAKTLNVIGNVYYDQGMLSNSFDIHFQALKIAEAINDNERMIFILNNIGRDYTDLEEYSKALNMYFYRALRIANQIGNKWGIALVTSNIGWANSLKGNDSLALKYYFLALKKGGEIENLYLVHNMYSNIGGVYRSRAEFSKALNYLGKALLIAESIKYKKGIARRLTDIGEVYLLTKDYQKAKEYFLRSLALSKSIASLNEIQKNIENLSMYYSETGNYKQAFYCYKKSMAMKDSILNIKSAQKITATTLNLEFEKTLAVSQAEKKRAVAETELQKQKTIRNSTIGFSGIILLLFGLIFYKRRRDSIEKQKEISFHLQVSETEMKALRSQMNPHFIFNALQSIQTFLLSHRPDDANIYLLKFSKLMRLVLENSQYREVSLQKDMQALELYMQLESIRFLHPFTYKFHIDESINMEETTIPPLILQPFVENAIWHGLQYKNESGHINIYINRNNNSIYAIVEDNGVGREMSRRTELAIPIAAGIKKESLGMKLTEERLKILNESKNSNAQFKITDLFTKENHPAGTRVELSLPLVA